MATPEEHEYNIETMCIVLHNAHQHHSRLMGIGGMRPRAWADMPAQNQAATRAAVRALVAYLTGEGLVPEDWAGGGVCPSISRNGMTRCRLVAGHVGVHTAGAQHVWTTEEEL